MSYRSRRYGGRYRGRRSTGVIKMKFQSFMDISTSDSSMQIITVSAGGRNLVNRCPAQFAAYKYFKMGSVSVKLVPASTLPVDPTGLSIATGDQKVDPRDQLTPGMMRITNGEDILEDLTGLSDAEQHGIYNNMLLDPRWFKWMLQSGVKRHASPRFWQVGQLHQDKWPGAVVNLPTRNVGNQVIDTSMQTNYVQVDSVASSLGVGHSSDKGFFQVGHSGRVGWLPTDGYQLGKAFIAAPLEVEVMKILLPKAYKTKYWYRMFITETVYFREPIVTMAGLDQYRPLDIFHYTIAPRPAAPNTVQGTSQPSDSETGGNYGNY